MAFVVILACVLASCGAPPPPPEAPRSEAPRSEAPRSEAPRPVSGEDVDGFRDGDGLPDPDNDADGVLDAQDNCPCHPEDADGFEEEDGCPDWDNDRDRIVDPCDQCPNEPEVYNGVEDLDGCPDRAIIQILGSRIQIVEHVYFDKNSAAIPASAQPLLDAVAAVLRDYPHIELLEVEGHAAMEERGATRLASRRAEAVRQALLARGVAPSRLRAQGYGTTRPLDTNATPRGRERNRRAQFRIVQAAAPPSAPAPAPHDPCPTGPPPEPASVCE